MLVAAPHLAYGRGADMEQPFAEWKAERQAYSENRSWPFGFREPERRYREPDQRRYRTQDWRRRDYSQEQDGFFRRFFRPAPSTRPAPPAYVPEPEKPIALVYQPAPLVPLADGAISLPEPSGPVARGVYRTLSQPEQPVIRVRKEDREAILAFYAARGFEPVWVGTDQVGTRGARLLDVLARADEEGFDKADYLPTLLTGFDDRARHLAAEDLGRLDVELTAAALKYARHASAGRLIPSRLSRFIDVHPTAAAPDAVLSDLAVSTKPGQVLAGLHPKHEVYRLLKEELARLRQEAGGRLEASIPSGGLIRVGMVDSRVPLIRRKLESLDLLSSGEATAGSVGGTDIPDATLVTASVAVDDLYTDELAAAVRDFQRSAGLSADGIVGPATIAAMNGDNVQERIRKLVVNLERVRWLPKDLGDKYVFVNQPAFELRLMDNGEVAWQTRVIIGTYRNQTPTFSDEMEEVDLNPYWNVPRSIATKEMLPELWSDPYYLDSRGYEVFHTNGQRISSASVDWTAYTPATMPFSIRQPPGPSNALGKMKFLFPNKHAVYMHDTPQKHLFERTVRSFSHGCVRVQHADRFAEIVLATEGWTPAAINAAVATGANQSIKLSRKIPVHLAYFTAWADERGVRYFDDVYKRDELVERALNGHRMAMDTGGDRREVSGNY